MPRYGRAEIRNLTKVIESGRFCDHRGGFMDKFREDFAKAYGVKHALSGGAAMLLMHAIPGTIGAGAGDEIICDPVVQFHGIACLHNNVIPVWADVRRDNFLMDPKSVEKKITRRTKAIWVTHLWGFPAEVDKLRRIADRHGIYLLEDCAHAMFAKYKGRYVGKWGHIGTYSFNMGKQLPTGEGGMAITNDDTLAAELGKRIIFGESPEVLSSNYRMTEFQAAVGVEQLKKVPGYLKKYREGKKYVDAVVRKCAWLDERKAPAGSTVAPYAYACIFRGEGKKVDFGVFKSALRKVGGGFGWGFTQRPAYMYDFFRNPNAYGNKGCPYNCHLYKGTVNWKAGMCPTAEDVIPRLIVTSNMTSVRDMKRKAKLLQEAIDLTEAGAVEAFTYSEMDRKVLEIVRTEGPIEPLEVIDILKKKDSNHMDEHRMFSIMENLRDGFPYKLSHAGPRKFAYHDLS